MSISSPAPLPTPTGAGNPDSPILLLGSSGLLGRPLAGELRRRQLTVWTPPHREVDICEEETMHRLLDRKEGFLSVINAAAFCSFSGCEEDPRRSERTNLEAPIRWATACSQRGIHFVQFSSDYIYDGSKNAPYGESDPPRPLNVYGRHKAQVEEVLSHLPGTLVLRVAWLFGPEGRTFLSLLPELLRREERVRVASGKKGSCLNVELAAGVIADLAQRQVAGRYNLVHRGVTAWETFATRCLEELHRRGLSPRCRSLEEIPYTDLPHGAGQRPGYSVLEITALEAVLGRALPDWETGLQDYLDRLYPRESIA